MSIRLDVHSLLDKIKAGVNGNTDNFKKDIRDLLFLCNGPQSNDLGLPFTRVLNSQEFLVALLSINKCKEFLKDKQELSAEIVETLFKLVVRPWDIIYTLVKNITESNYIKKNKFIKDTWAKKESLDIPVDLALLLIEEDASLVENHFLEMYQSKKSSQDLWKERVNSCFIEWSVKSPQVFHILASVLNAFLIHAKNKTIILNIIADFIENIILECEKSEGNVLFLYPLEYQSLISSLMLGVDINPCKTFAINRLKELQMSNPSVALMFLSHFPVWVNALKEEKKKTVKHFY